MRDKYLYFGLNAAGTEAFDNHTAQTVQLTTGFVNPIPVGVDYLTNGGAKVTVAYHAEHTYGTAYTATSGEIDITAGCTIHPTSALITIATAAADPVYGWTKSGTGANNDLDVTQLKPYDAGDGYVYNSKYLNGMHYQTTTTTELHFQGQTGKIGATNDDDVFVVTHGTGKHKEFMRGLTDIVASDSAVDGMVVIADDMRAIVMPHDESAIASVTATIATD